MKPEQKARLEIDKLLCEAGFLVLDYRDSKPDTKVHYAVREFVLKNGTRADYVLFVAGRACAVIEAKKPNTLSGAENQAHGYAQNLAKELGEITFLYQSNANELFFTNLKEPKPKARKIFAFHSPKELQAKLDDESSLRARISQLPLLESARLRDCQKDAIVGLEKSLRDNKQRALVYMATGAGKTFTACNIAYRLIAHAKAKRILFLVDRNNLGKQTKKEFDNFAIPKDKRHFSEIYNVVHLETNMIPEESKVIITTIQRLYSMLCGESEFDSTNEEHSGFESHDAQTKEVTYNPQMGIDTFDFIIIDECHRSIYGQWRQVLEYFDAFLIGLSATPSKHTLGFFAQNVVAQYDLEKSILDKVNVGYEIFRIKTQISEKGSVIEASAEFQVPFRDKETRKIGYETLEEDLEYSKSDLDRSVLAPSQIRTILQTYKDKVFTELFPERKPSYLPKTLIFAKDDNHAEEIVRIAREVFNESNTFAQKITYNIGNQNPHELINRFRNSKQFRIAVTVDMIATGTDIKPLEVLIFMRDIKSASYYAQMVGRGVRSIHREDLRAVTPNADSKTHFYVIDAVGVSESQKLDSRPLERKKSLNFKEILNCVRESVEKDDYEKDMLLSLASRLSRLELKLGDDDNASLKDSSGKSLCALASEILEFADSECSEHSLFQAALSPCQTEIPICQAESPLSDSKSPIYDSASPICDSVPPSYHSEPNLPCHSESPICHSEPLGEESQKEESQNKESPTNPLEIFRDESFCNRLLALARKSKIYIDETSQDCVLHTGFDTQNAQNLINKFLDFILRNKDEIEALSIIYARDYKNRHLTYRVISELATKLKRDFMDIPSLWNAFALRDKDRVSRNPSKNLTNLISLVRYALHHDDRLQDFSIVSISRYNLWIGRCMQKGMRFSPEQEEFLELIRDYIIANGVAEIADIQEICADVGGLYRARALFKESLETLIDELGMSLVG